MRKSTREYRLLGLDCETTGTNLGKDRVVELGGCLWSTALQRPLTLFNFFYWDDAYPALSKEVTDLTGITREFLQEFRTDAKESLIWLDQLAKERQVEFIVAHNGRQFDQPFLMAELDSYKLEAPTLRSLPWIDTRFDIPFAKEPESRRLKHLACDVGFLNPFPHCAVFDVMTMLKVLSQYDIEQVISYSQIPWIIVRAMVSYEDRQLAKDRKYSWEKIEDKVFPKCWVKRIKKTDLEKECQEAPFKVMVLEE